MAGPTRSSSKGSTLLSPPSPWPTPTPSVSNISLAEEVSLMDDLSFPDDWSGGICGRREKQGRS